MSDQGLGHFLVFFSDVDDLFVSSGSSHHHLVRKCIADASWDILTSRLSCCSSNFPPFASLRTALQFLAEWSFAKAIAAMPIPTARQYLVSLLWDPGHMDTRWL